MGKLVNQSRHAAHKPSLDPLPETAGPPEPNDPLEMVETRAFAKARYRSLQVAGATACLRVRPTDSLLVKPEEVFVDIGRRLTGIEEYVTVRCPCRDTVDMDTRHERICPRAGEQVNPHQPLLHTMSRTLKGFGIPRQGSSRGTLDGGDEPEDGHRR